MYKVFRRPLVYLVTILVLIVLIVHIIKNKNQSDEGTALPKYLKRDYVLFEKPVQEQLTSNKKKTIRPNKVNIYKLKTSVYIDQTLSKVYLKTFKGKTPIFIHSPNEDRMISAYVRDYGTWEEDLLNQTGQFLLHHPDITFVDLGCNIGVYTLFVAKLGIKVVSVDPVKNNLRLLSKSLDAGGISENVTLILNAMSDEYKTVSIDIPKENIGGAHIAGDIKVESDGVETILIDDIIPYVKTDKTFLKMDVEGHEWNILNGGNRFFQIKNVKAILMEWVHHRHQSNGKLIVDYLIKNGMLPYTDISMTRILDPDSYYMWPENIFWIKR